MIKLEGTLINTFRVEGGTGKDGKEYEARDKIQILGAMELPSGQVQNALYDLTVEDSSAYEAFKNKLISVSCGAMAIGKNVVFYVRKGSKPTLVVTS